MSFAVSASAKPLIDTSSQSPAPTLSVEHALAPAGTSSKTNSATPIKHFQFDGGMFRQNLTNARLKAIQWVEDHIHLRPDLLDPYRNLLIAHQIWQDEFCDWSELHGYDRDDAQKYEQFFTGVSHRQARSRKAKQEELEALCPPPMPDPKLILALASECGWEKPSPSTPKEKNHPGQSQTLATQPQANSTLPPPATRYQLQSAADLMNAPPMKWLIRDILPATGLAALYGSAGSGKTFLTLDLCIAVASGKPWFGHFVQAPASVVYVALEGQRGFGQRLEAWTTAHGAPLPERLQFLAQSFNLREGRDVEDLCKAVLARDGQGGLIVLDTLSRAAPGTGENSASDMGELIAACTRLQEKTGGIVLVIHHTGKTEGKGLRGHSSLNGALDCTIETSRTGNHREWSLTKSRDSADGLRHGFKLKLIPLKLEESGQPRTSFVVEPVDGPPPSSTKRLPASLRAIKPIFDQLSKSMGGAPVRFSDLCKAAKEQLGGKFRKDNTRRDYGKYHGVEPPSDDTLVNF